MTVHPHVCGEIRMRRPSSPSRGSPPRVWGNRLADVDVPRTAPVHPHVCGEIRTASPVTSTPSSVHPHVCGEIARRPDRHCASGSPPRVWGNPEPAGPAAPRCGSPPRVWGNPRVRQCGGTGVRFTPTCVGKSHRSVCAAARRRFTPTCVGKSMRRRRHAAQPLGSPPRVWGNLTCSRSHAPLRFTPTCVGKSHFGERRHSATVHPHVCGEIYGWPSSSGDSDGSPPRVWGNLRFAAAARRRFTPTCVGKSAGLDGGRCSVHPHVCGEISDHMLRL